MLFLAWFYKELCDLKAVILGDKCSVIKLSTAHSKTPQIYGSTPQATGNVLRNNQTII